NKYIKQGTILKLIRQAWDAYASYIPENIPKDWIQQNSILSLKDTIYFMHFPKNEEELERAKYSVVFREFFIYQLRLGWMKKQAKLFKKGASIDYDVNQLKNFFASLTYELTSAQKRVVNEVCRDLKSPYQMFRLLQGDVGSGKTVVAASAMLAAKSA